MYLDSAKKEEIFGKFGKGTTDTGSAESQIALFSFRISHLTEHMKQNRKDHSTERTVYEVSSTGYGVKGAPWAFSGFTAASFDESCRDWNPTSMVFFFSGCSKAESIDCTNLNTASVADMSCMFQKCRALQSLDLTGFDTANVIEMYRLCPAQLING